MSILKIPESANCPACGSYDYITVHSDLAPTLEIRLVNLRRCAECDARYSPPVRRWVSCFAIVLGTAVAAVSIFLSYFLPSYLADDEELAKVGTQAFFYVFAVIGGAFAARGIVQLFSYDRRPHPVEEVSQVYFVNEEVD